MQYYESEALKYGVDVACNAEVVKIEKHKGIPAYAVTIEEVDLSKGDPRTLSSFTIQARAVINCAGIGSGRIAALAGIDIDQVGHVWAPSFPTPIQIEPLPYCTHSTSIAFIQRKACTSGHIKTWINIPECSSILCL